MNDVDVDRIKAQVAAAAAARPQDPLLSPTPLKPSPEAAQAHARRLAQAAKVRRGLVMAAKLPAEGGGRALPLLPPADIVQPAFISATPIGILVQDNRAPDDNWAQVEFTATADLGVGTVGFFYIWTNPTPDTVGLSVATVMGFVGHCSAKAGGFWGGHAHLVGGGSLSVYAGDDVFSVARTDVVEVTAHSSGFWVDSYKAAPVDALVDLSYDHLVVPGGGTIVVEAHAYFIYNNSRTAEETFDFAGPNFRVSNPNMTFTPRPIIIT